jgi:signal transduction histidine kinase
MSLHVGASLLAAISYAGLLMLVLRHGLRENRPSQVFSFYLFDMVLIQIGLLMISLADSAPSAFFWYIFLIPVGAGQSIIYFFFTGTLLGLRQSRRLVQLSTMIWLLTVVFSLALSRRAIYIDIYRDEATGLFVPEFGPLLPILAVPIMLFWGLAAFNLIRGYREVQSLHQRARVQYLLMGVFVVWMGMTANAFPALRPYPVDVVANVIAAFLITYVILRYQLLDINVVVRKGLLYSVPTIILGAGYFLIIYFTTRLFHGLAGPQIFLLSLVVAIVAAIVAQPLRDRVQRGIDRAFFRERYDGSVMVQRLSHTATSLLDLERLTAMILDDVTETMRIQWAALLLKQQGNGDLSLTAQRGLNVGSDLRLEEGHPIVHWLSSHEGILTTGELDTALHGQAPESQKLAELRKSGAELLVPLRARSELIGVLAIGPKLSQQGYTQDDELILTTLANQTAVAIQNARLLELTREQVRQVQQIIDTVPEGVLLLDAERRVVLANPVAQGHLVALTSASAGGVPTHLGDRALAELLTSPPEGLWHEVSADGQQFEVIARPLEIGPTPEGWVMVVRNVTQEREIEQRIRQQERLAAVGQLAAGIAHDFNNIMATIVLYAQMLSRVPSLSNRDRERLAMIDRQAKHATNLIQQILDFSRRAVLERHPLDLASLLQEQVRLLERTLPENIKIELGYRPGEYPVNADPTRVQQAMMNLALNARDAMPDGGELHFELEWVRIEDRQDTPLPDMEAGEWVQVTVSDTGAGIPPDALPHVFDPFFTTKAPGKGTGLGLAQVYGIVTQHKGHIDVESQEGQGTTFTIYLPTLPVRPAEAPALEMVDLIEGQGETVLVVEDNAFTRRALVESLELLNYQVREAGSGQEALEILERSDNEAEQVMLVLSDVVMPRMGGIALLKSMRERGLKVHVVLLTGHPLEKELEHLRADGTISLLVDWLLKPVTLERLAEVVARGIKRAI